MLTLFLFAFAISNVSHAEMPESPKGLDYRIDASATYYNTSVNWKTGGGATQDLNNGGYFTDVIGQMTYSQDLDRERRVYGGFTYSATESYDGTITRTNAGFNELLAGGQYWYRVSGYRLVPSADLVYPLVRVNREGDDALLGEGAIKAKFGSWLLFPNGHWVPFGYLGYEYRDEGRSHALPYSVGIKWKSSPLWAQLEYRGYERLFANADSENRNSRDAFLRRVNGGSYRYYSINPSYSEFAVEAGYGFGSISLYGGFAISVNGSSAADGWLAMAGVAYSPLGTMKAPPDEFERINSPSTTPDRFTPSVDPFDEFDPTKPPKEQSPPVPPPPRRKSAPPAQRPAPPPAAEQPQELTPNNPSPTEVQPPPAPAPKVPAQPVMPKVELRPAPKKATPKPPPKPKPKPKPKKNKVDKILEQTEEGLKNL